MQKQVEQQVWRVDYLKNKHLNAFRESLSPFKILLDYYSTLAFASSFEHKHRTRFMQHSVILSIPLSIFFYLLTPQIPRILEI